MAYLTPLLQELEKRVTELEEENENLRVALALPPANRLPLGHGPTGRDKARQCSDRLGSVGMEEGSVSPQTSSSSHNSSSFVTNGVSSYADFKESNRSWEHIVVAAPKDEYMDKEYDAVMTSGIASSSYDQGYGLSPSRISSSAPSSSRSSINGAFYLSPTSSSLSQTPDKPTTSSSTFSRDDSFGYPTSNLLGNGHTSEALRGLPSPAPANFSPSAPYHHGTGTSFLGGDPPLPHNPPHTYQSPQFQREQYQPQGQSMMQNGNYGMRKSASESNHFPTSLASYPSSTYAQQRLRTQVHSTPPSIRLPSPGRPQAVPNYVQKSPSCPGYVGPEGTSQSSFHRPT